MIDILQEIGFSRNESKIYLALLELGPSNMGKICGKTKIHRRNVYDCLEMLKEKGFVWANIVNGRNIFEATSPQNLIDILDSKKEKLLLAIPQFPSKKQSESKIKIYTGQAGRKTMFEEKLREKGEQYVLGAHLPSPQSRRFVDLYHHRRVQRKIRLKMIFNSDKAEAANLFSKYKYVEVRILPKKSSSSIAINIYNKTVAFLLGSSTLEPITILIEDQSMANEMKSYFNLLWKISLPLSS